jgi:hypothetical protein
MFFHDIYTGLPDDDGTSLLGAPHELGKRHPHNIAQYFQLSNNVHDKLQWWTQVYFLVLFFLVMVFLLV